MTITLIRLCSLSTDCSSLRGYIQIHEQCSNGHGKEGSSHDMEKKEIPGLVQTKVSVCPLQSLKVRNSKEYLQYRNSFVVPEK